MPIIARERLGLHYNELLKLFQPSVSTTSPPHRVVMHPSPRNRGKTVPTVLLPPGTMRGAASVPGNTYSVG